MPRKPGNYSRFDAGKQEIFWCWYGVAGVIALLADSQNTPIRMAWAGWPQAGWNHTGRGSVPTQEEKFPVDSRSAFHAPIRKSGIPDLKTGKSFSDFAESLLTKHTMKRNYLVFHTFDPDVAIDDLIEINRQRKAQ